MVAAPVADKESADERPDHLSTSPRRRSIPTVPHHVPAERVASNALREHGVLTAAYSPGAVLMLNGADLDSARRIGEHLPLATAGLIDIKIIPLTPLAF
jgi:hypothetical protein